MKQTMKKPIPEIGELKSELKREKYKRRYAAILRSTVFTLVVVAAFAILVATLWMPVLQIYGTSMAPALEEGQIVVSVKTADVKQGDMAAFYIGNKLLVKRVIACPGDVVRISEDGTVFVNDAELEEPYVSEKALGECDLEFPYEVPQAGYFLMGDNREASMRSIVTTDLRCISYMHAGEPIADAAVSLYRVADVSETGAFTLTGDFAAYPVTLQNLSDTEWQQLADTLVGYVGRDGLTALDSGKTDTDGTLVFPCQQQNLHPGLYLVVIQRLQEGRYTYIAKPFLTCLPGLLQNEDTWAYDVIVTPKYERDYDTSDTPATVTRKVLKVWKDDGKKSTRPKEITVQLLQNGSVYDTVALREDNNWRYTWEKLDKNYDWTVVEKEVDGYTVRVSQEGTAFVITNTYDADVPETTTAVTTTVRDPAEPPSASTEPPSEPIEPEDTPNRPQLPATGQLWWPVTVLAAVGLLLILAGVLWNRGADDEA